MSFAQEMKDFVSAFKTMSDIGYKQAALNKKSYAERKAETDAAERKSAEDAGERAFEGRRGQALSALPEADSGARKVSSEGVGSSNEVEDEFIKEVSTGDGAVTNPYALAAVRAYGKAESSYKPTAISDTWNDPDPKGNPGRSGGVLSWREDRLRNMQDFVTKAGGNSPTTQAKFFKSEDPGLIKALNVAKSTDEAERLMRNAWRFRDFDKPDGYETNRRRGLTNEYYKKYYAGDQVAALPVEGNLVAYAAEGGVIDPEDAEVETEVPDGEYASVRALPIDNSGAPAKTVTPAIANSTYVDDASNSNSGASGSNARQYLNPERANEAVAAGMDYIQQMFTGGSAIAQADPDRPQKVNAFARNEGVASTEDVKAVDSIIDPKGELAPHLRAMARLNGAYEMYLRKGEPEKAARMAASIAMYARKVAMSGGAQIQALVEKGNMAGAAKAMERVYDEMPNGNNVEVKPVKGGGFEYKVFDVDGNPTDGGRMAIDEVLRLATGLQDGTAWLQGMGFMAGQYKQQQRGTGNRLNTRANPIGRSPAAPRTTATERAANAAAEAERAARGQRGEAIAGKAQALDVGPDLTPSQSNMPTNVGNAPPELATVEGVPVSSSPTYNAGTGVRRVMPEEGQQGVSSEERSAGEMSTAGERVRRQQQLVTGARTDEALVRADKEYNARANRKGVRTTDSSSSRTDNAEKIAEGFTQSGNKTLPPERAGVINGIASKIMRGNEGYTASDAGRVIGEIMQKGPALRPDGTVAARGGVGAGVYLDSGSIKQLVELYGGKLPSVSGVDTKITPKSYNMPEGRKYSSEARSIADAMRGGAPSSDTPPRRNRYTETWRKRYEENKRNGGG